MKTESDYNQNVNKVGYYSSILMVIITIITWAIAMTALPNSGEYCIRDCVDYPYLDTLSEFPGDYIWMFIAPIQLLVYLVFIISLHAYASKSNKIFGMIGLMFGGISAAVLLVCYFTQFSVVPASLLSNETEGIALLTQYNPHGIFIVMEELGYIMMSISFLFLAFIFTEKSRLEISIRWIFIISFILTVAAFIMVTLMKGIIRSYLFELIVISIDWFVLIINGILLSILFKKRVNRICLNNNQNS